MHEIEQKRIVIGRIIAHLNPAPENCVNDLLHQSLPDLQVMLGKLADTKAQEQAEEAALAHKEENRRASQFDGAWVGALRNVSLNGKRLCDVESNRAMLECLLQGHEVPSASLYGTIALSYPTKFSWEVPRPKQTDADRQAEFARICRENSLSECAANQQLHKEGAALEAWAGASGLERAKFQAEATQARRHFLIHSATPQQLKQEAAWESQQNRAAAVQAEADRAHNFVAQAQAGLYSPLPTHKQAGELMDAKYFRRLSTVDFAAFKLAVKKWGTAQITEVLRTPAAPAV
jgi:hypothetical protein